MIARLRNALARGLVAAMVLLAGTGGAAACLVCVPFPTRTPADLVLDAAAVGLAREDPERPFRLSVTEVAKGPTEATGPTGVYLPAADRRRLAERPETAVVLLRATPEAEWTWHLYADAAYLGFVRDTLARAEAWRADPQAPSRLAYFEALLDHPNGDLRRAALLEVGRAPYARIREAAARAPAPMLREALDTPTWYDWRPLYILMLAAQRDPFDVPRLETGYRTAWEFGDIAALPAWATALIEIHGPEGLARVADDVMTAAQDKAGLARAAFTALSVQGETALRPEIVEVYRRALAERPALAAQVARDMAAWEDWSLAPEVARLLEAHALRDPAALFAGGVYVGMARDRGAF